MWSTARPVKKAMREAEEGTLVPRRVVTRAAFEEAFDKLRHDINGKTVEGIRSRRAPAAGSRRTLPLTAPLKAALEAAQRRQRRERLALGPDYGSGEYVVSNEEGRAVQPCGPLALLGIYREGCRRTTHPTARRAPHRGDDAAPAGRPSRCDCGVDWACRCVVHDEGVRAQPERRPEGCCERSWGGSDIVVTWRR